MRPSRRDLQIEVMRRFENDRRQPGGGYRKLLVDYLNSATDQRAIGRITELVRCFQIVARGFNRTSEELRLAHRSRNPERISQDSCVVVNALNEVNALMSRYSFRSFVCPYPNSEKWTLGWPCQYRPESESPSVSWMLSVNLSRDGIFELLRPAATEQEERKTGEGDAVEAVLFILADGLVDTIRRCDWEPCSKWFVGVRRDPRLRFCNRQCEEASREAKVKRKEKRRIYAQKRQTDDRNIDEQQMRALKADLALARGQVSARGRPGGR
jgi:hypothetical protein